ncbi:PIG-L deacetylase family protein [Thalassospira povalilytica]|uniref:PIG-L deacetylase family protein n=1 Tax=Thalassospira povalilytica TaxID=732237 RepID=UPI001D17D56A|nr:PIG-L deacetylase family protein [Thalassospira povalilytica]MCC4241926.1 PIG-L family deacetylase [Thalassospira povalilytica]
MGNCSQNVLVVVAHSDDEALGCGASIARHVENGDNVYVLSMTDGVGARHSGLTEVTERQQAAENSARVLGFKWAATGSFPDNALDTVPLLDLAKFIEAVKADVKPAIVYTHSAADLNIDHRRVCEATLTAFRPQPNEVFSEIRCFETASATDYGHKSVTGTFTPNLFVNVASVWHKKVAALEAYHAEMRQQPHSRSLEGLEYLARIRGVQNGIEMAEAFEVLRKIER